MVDQRDSRPWLSVGIVWASRITTLALEFTVPVLFGVGLDHWLGSSPMATISGAVLGFVLFMLHTLRFAKELPDPRGRAVRRSIKQPAPTEDDELPGGL